MQENKFVSKEELKVMFNQLPNEKDKIALVKKFEENGYVLEGLNETKQAVQNSLSTKLGNRFTDIGTSVGNVAEKLANTNPFQRNAQGQTELNMNVVKDVAKTVGQETLRGVGAGAGAIADIGAKAVETGAGALNKATGGELEAGARALLNTEVGQKAINAFKAGQDSWNEYKRINPDTAKNVESAFNILNLTNISQIANLAGKGALKAGEVGLKATDDLINAGEQAVKNVSSKIKPFKEFNNITPETAVSNVKENLLEQIYGKSSLIKTLDKASTDIIDNISKNPRYLPDIDVENKSFDVTEAVRNVTADKTSFSNKLKELFTTADNELGSLNTSDLIKSITDNVISGKNKSSLVVGGANNFKEISDMTKRLRQVYGDTISRVDIWDVRKKIDDSIEAISDTNLKKSLRSDVRKAFASSLENSLGKDSTLVKRSMAELQKLIEVEDFLKGSLNGAKIQGGKLTDIIRNAVGSNLGQTVGAGVGGVLGSVPGAVVGYGVSKKIGDWLAKNTLTSAADRRALQLLKEQQPDIWKEVESYITNIKKSKKTQTLIENNIKLLE